MEKENVKEINPAEQHPADIADALQQMPTEEAVAELRALPPETASEVLSELDSEIAAEITAQLSNEEITDLVEEMPHDEAADIVAELSPEQQFEVLSHLDPPESAKVSQLMRYPEDSAGGIMKDEFIFLPSNMTLAEGLNVVRKKGEEEFEGTTYVYVVDEHNKLVGTVAVRDLVFRHPSKKLNEIMNPEIRYVRVDMDQEEVARLFSQYHYKALPVVEMDGRLVGVVDADQVLEVLQEEATEDMLRMGGIPSGEEHPLGDVKYSVKKRLPWMMANIFFNLLAVIGVAIFEESIATVAFLAVLMPIVSDMGGNIASQAMSVAIRGMATGQVVWGQLAMVLR
ncbi:MAG TPA: magnesium transporter, partial [Kiritimatiellia bacterium]|nr:magnesium transporter [Kiritimatiellia bacterium]